MKNVLKTRYMSEKVQNLQQLKNNESNKSVRKFNKDVVAFIVDVNANKAEIKAAVEKIYNVKVESVNTSITSTKVRRVRGRSGETQAKKKAYVTLKPGFSVDQ
ncbi:MAG: 50S ribosomal protein L23 [Chlamydiae bacterium]|jgi:large subunit ribosomal protein L23|nr:50S ribosomal protein L23 [Chlamydiota bacterium]NDE63118.1 50S ribosomal protein L23 [Chlamydiota bacterium]